MSTHSSRGAAWEAIRDRVLERDGYRCAYCGNEATEADHVIPKVKGGTDTMDNLVSACRRCNGSKQDRIEARTNWFNRNWLTNI